MDDRRHAEKMAAKKAARAKILATKTLEKGLIIVHTGTGKGKSTAAFGMVIRAIGHGLKTGIVKFTKGRWETGETKIFQAFPENVSLFTMGEGFTWEVQDRQRDVAAARAGWEVGLRLLADPAYQIVVLDELNIVLRYDYLAIEDVCAALTKKLPQQHVIITGRNAKPALIEMADLVTEMTLIKHPFRVGVKAQPGIEF